MRVTNQEQPFHPIYNYALITDAEEGLILVDVNTLQDGEARNNFLKRALTWNPGGVLKGATHVTLGGHYAYVALESGGLGVFDVVDPAHPDDGILREQAVATLGALVSLQQPQLLVQMDGPHRLADRAC